MNKICATPRKSGIRKSLRLLLLVFLSIYSWFLPSALAHTNLFLPGDAFFSARLSEDFFDKQKEAATLDLSYERYTGHCADCTWYGYENLRIRNLPETSLTNLKTVHQIIFRLFPKEALTNPFDTGEKHWFPPLRLQHRLPRQPPRRP